MEIHIGQLIKDKLERSGMKKSEFARRINKTSQNVYDIFERKSIDTALLASISEVLHYNFFEWLSLQYNTQDQGNQALREMAAPYYSSGELIQAFQDKSQELMACHVQVVHLEKEIAYLQEINALLRLKNK
jgi:plasmid maintenance system antidote protein VapI